MLLKQENLLIMNKIDVCLNMYGKPYQTIITIKSLLYYSGNYIDKIFIIIEPKQPEFIDLEFIKTEVNYDKIIFYSPKYYLGVDRTNINTFINNEDYRLSVRYQFGFENTDKKYILTIHNDVLFQNDIVSYFIDNIANCAGIGQIGQCWNCPMYYENKCNGEKIDEFKPNYNEVMSIVENYPNTRTFIFKSIIDKLSPMPLPECRLNEWCCLIDVNIYKNEVIPNGNILPFGGVFKLDTADEWFRGLVLKGYKFKNVDISKWCTHGYFSEINRGNPSRLNHDIYIRDENLARGFYYNEENKFLK